LAASLGPAYRDTIGLAVDPIFLAPLVLLLATFGQGSAPTSTLRRGLTWLGSVSYGLYLYHPLAISTVLHFSPHRGPLEVAAAFALSTVAAAASYYSIERPFAATKARAPRATRTPAPVTPWWTLLPVRVPADRTSWVG
jgi:peptidoglycan/LPS O-acetylase OafA/YrhL